MSEGESRSGPPIPTLKESYVNFKKEVNLWKSITNINEEKQAGSLLLKLPEKAKSVALDMSIEELQKGVSITVNDQVVQKTGVECLLDMLDKIYMEDVAKEKFNSYDAFRKLERKSKQSMKDYILDFEKAVKRLKEYEIDLPPPVLAYELLRSANVSDYRYSVAVAIVGDLTYENMKDTVRKITELDEPSHTSSGSTSKSSIDIEIKQEPEDLFYASYNDEDGTDDQNSSFVACYSRGRGNRSRQQYPYRRQSNNFSYRGQYNTPRQEVSQNWRTRSSSKAGFRGKKPNPKDRMGNTMTCNVCNSIYHFAKDCLEFNSEKQFYNEDITLFQNSPSLQSSPNVMESFTRDNFGLAVLDSGCNVTVCGQDWLTTYLDSLDDKDLVKVKYDENDVSFRFGDNHPTKSTKRCSFPAVVCKKNVTITAQIVSDQIPLLISKQTMKCAKMILDFNEDTVQAFGNKEKIVFTESGHCSIPLSRNTVHNEVCVCSTDNVFLNVETNESSLSMATKLHKQFAHPNAESLKSLLRAAGKLSKDMTKAVDEITKSCEICRRYCHPKKKPIVCMPLAKDCNETVAMDIKVFDANKNIYFQHMIDHKSRFSTAKVLRSKNKDVVIDSVMTHWVAIFGTPNKFMSDNGGEYVNSSFMDLCEKLNVHVATTGAESPWSNGLVERHHALLANNVNKIIEETGCSIETALAWAIHAKNSLSNINGFSPYQLMFGRNPNLPSLNDPYSSPTVVENESPSEEVAKHIKAIYAARRAQMESEADEKIRRALRSQTRDVYSENLQFGDLVYYKRDNCKRWRGPGSIAGIDGKIIFVRHGGYLVRCHRIRVVKVNDLYNKSSDSSGNNPPDTDKSLDSENNKGVEFSEAQEMMRMDSSISSKCNTEQENNDIIDETVHIIADSGENEMEKLQKLCSKKAELERKEPVIRLRKDSFLVEKHEEIEKWKKNHVYEEVNTNDLSENDFPISTRWVLTENDSKRKARLVARGFEEDPLRNSETVSPTCRKESLRLLFSFSATNKWTVQSLDIASAFLQGKEIQRKVFIIPPKEFHKDNVVWKLNKCVYGLSDAARMWYMNVKEQVQKSGLIKCPYDDALFYKHTNGQISGMMTIHVDDFVFAGTKDFENDVRSFLLNDFEIKSSEELSFTFLGLEVSQNEQDFSITVSQKKYINELAQIPLTAKRKMQKMHAVNTIEYKKFRAGLGQLLWISLQTRPDISFEVCQLSNHLSDPNVEDLKRFNKIVRNLQDSNDMCLHFKEIPGLHSNPKLITFSDAAFGNLPKQGSQSGYITFLTDKESVVKNPIVWKSVKLNRVCQSTVAAESLGLLNAIDHTLFIEKTLKDIIGTQNSVEIQCFVDNKGLLELVYKTKDPVEKRLICTVASIREMIERGELTVIYIPSKKMPADVLTKRGPSNAVIRSHLDL